MKRLACWVSICLMCALVAVLGGCGGGGAIKILISSGGIQAIDQGQTLTLTATVSNGSNGQGVTWTITSGPGTLSGASATSVTYTAPASVTSATSVTITATLTSSNSSNSTVTQTFTFTITPPPSLGAGGNLAAGTEGTAYNQSPTVTGGAGTLAWVVQANPNPLPAGLSMNSSTGAITGTPTGPAGSSTFTVQVTDSGNPKIVVSAQFTILINNYPAPTIAPVSGALPGGVEGTAYAQQTFTVSGGHGPFTFSIINGSLPAGLTQSSSNNTLIVSGTPTGPPCNPCTFSVKVVDTSNPAQTVTNNYSIVISQPPPPSITTTTLPAGVEGTAYNQTVIATGGLTPYTFSIVVPGTGTLPAGLNMDSSGHITGKPTGPNGTSNFTVKVTDSSNPTQSATQNLSITVNLPPAPAITTTQAQLTAAPATAGAAYPGFTFNATGTGTLTWSATGLPADGLSLSPTGVLSGTPTSQASINIMMTVSDTYGQSSPATPFTITVNSPPAITSANNTTFTVGTAGTFTVTTTGSPAPSLSETGALPSGVGLVDNGNGTATLSGTPAANTGGVYTITIKATNTVATTPQTFTLTVDQAPAFTSANNTTFSVGAVGTFTVTATGPPTPSFSETGALPSNVTFVDNGNGTATLSGTPAAGTAGSYPITIKATNTVATTSQTFTLTVNTAPGFTSANNTTFTVGAAGTFTVTTTGTPTPSLSETGALPSGVGLVDNGNGTATLSGTPAAGTGGTYTITIKATNTVGTTPQTFTLTVDQAPAITSANNVTFTVGAFGTFTVTTSGFPAPALSDNSAALPSGVTFTDNGNGTGTLSGTPASGTANTYPITFTANNGVGSASNQSFTLTVNLAPVFTTGTSTTFTAGTAGTFTVTVTGTPTPSLSETGALPSGVTFVDNGNGTATLSGTPGASTGGQYQITIKATNTVATTPQTFTLTVDQAPAITSANNVTFTVGAFGTFTVTTSGFPAPALSDNSAALPSGVTFTDNGNGTGTLSGTPASGTANTYPITFTANNGIGSSFNQSFTLTVSVAAPCNSGSESFLKGQYAFLLQGFDTNGPTAAIGSFTADGTGKITAGELDLNNSTTGNAPPPLSIVTASSSYSVGLDTNGGYRGCLTINTTLAGTSTYRFVLSEISSNVATNGRMVEFDSTGTLAAGVMRQQSSGAFLNTQVAGNYAFGASSTESLTTQDRFGMAGTFSVSGTAISSGSVDTDENGNVDHNCSSTPCTFTGTRGSPDPNGRTSFTITPATTGGSSSIDMVYYTVSAGELLLMSNDSQSSQGIFAGTILKQSGTPFSNTSLSGDTVISLTGLSGGGGSPTPDVQVGLLSFPSLGNFTLNTDENPGNGAPPTTNSGSGTYSVASNGRVTITGSGGHNPVLYLVSPNKGFLVGTDGSVTTGTFEPQTGGPFSNTSASGVFGFGTIWPAEQNIGYDTGWAGFNGSGTLSGVSDSVDLNGGVPQEDADQPFSQDYAVALSGRGTVYNSGQSSTPSLIFYIVSESPAKAILMDAYNNSGTPITNPALTVAEHQ